MSKRVPGSMRTRQSLSDLIEGRLSSPDGRAELVRLATRLIVEEAPEASRDAPGREYYEHGASPGQGYRNGSRTGRLKTAEGLIEYAAPQIARRDEPFRSEIRDRLKGRTQALEDLAVELPARGLSVRDIEDAFRDESGRLSLSRTAVFEIGERLWADYQEFVGRDLSEYEIVYLFVDGIAERIRPGSKREPVLAARGFTSEGGKVLLHLMAGSKEDAETVTAFFRDMRSRGLAETVLDQLERLVFAPQRLEALIAGSIARQKSSAATRRAEVRRLEKQIREKDQALNRLYEAIEKGAVELDDTLGARTAKLRSERDDLIRLKAETERRADPPRASITPDKIRAFSKVMRKRLRDRDNRARKALLGLFVGRIEVGDDKIWISGPKAALAGAVAANDQASTGMVPGFDREWWAHKDSNLGPAD